MIQIPPIPAAVLIFGFIARLFGFFLIGASAIKAASEFLPKVKWLKQVIKHIPHLPLKTSTRKLLLIFTISLWLGSFLPLIQTLCYFTKPCQPIVLFLLIPASLALSVNNVMAGLILYIIYFTSES